MDWLSDIIQDWLYDVLKGSADGFFEALTGLTTNVADLTDVNPETFNEGLFTTIKNISDVAIVPVASLILCYLMTIHFIKIVQDRNTYKDMTFMPVFKWILTTTIGIILVTKTYDIVLAIFDVVSWILEQTGTVLSDTDTNMNLQDSLTTLVEGVDKTDMGTVFNLIVQLTLCKFLVMIVATLCKVLMYFRIISILVYSSAGAIPMSTLMDPGQNSVGQNYVKTLAALGLQGFFVMIIIAIFQVLIADLAANPAESVSDLIWGTVMYVIALCMGLFSTKKVADVMVGAH